MRKLIFIIFFTLIFFVVYIFHQNVLSYSSGAPTGYTNAPGETSCSQWACHNGPKNSCGGGSMLSAMEDLSNGYIPNTTYNIMPFVSQNGLTKIGFQTVTLFANGQGAGSVTITNTKTQLNTSDGKEYVTHTISGTTGLALMDWMYEWKAPPMGSGTVTIYGAFIASNNNMTADTGDCIYTDSLVIPEKTLGMNESDFSDFDFQIYQAITENEIMVNYFSRENRSGEIFIYSMKGSLEERKTLDIYAGENSFKINLSKYSNGIYLLCFIEDNYRKTVRFLKF